MANEIGTGGVSIGYCVEATAGTRPTSGYTAIPNVVSIGDVNPAPATYDVTDLSDTEYKRYIPGLKDLGSDIALTVNMCQAFITAWASLVSAATTAEASGKKTWYQVSHPKITKKFYFAGMPSSLGLPAIDTDTAYQGEAHITPNGYDGWV